MMSDAIVGEHARDRVVVDLSFVSYSSPRRASSPERLQADIIVCIIGIVSTLRERRPGVGAVVRSIHKTKEACAFIFFLWKRSRTYIYVYAQVDGSWRTASFFIQSWHQVSQVAPHVYNADYQGELACGFSAEIQSCRSSDRAHGAHKPYSFVCYATVYF